MWSSLPPWGESGTRGQSFAGIQTRVERPVRRGVELALFESTTSFEAHGVAAELKIIDLNDQQPIEAQLAQIPTDALVILDLPKSEFYQVARKLDALERITMCETSRLRSPRPDVFTVSLPHDPVRADVLRRAWAVPYSSRVAQGTYVHGPSKRDKERTGSEEESQKIWRGDL